MDSLLIGVLVLTTAAAFLLLQPVLPRLAERAAAWRVDRMLKRALPASHYSVFHDVMLPSGADAGPALLRVGHIVVSPYAVFVIEARREGGWISGSESDPEWIHTRFRVQRRFPNPLRQARTRVRALQELLSLDASAFQPLVVFAGGAQFRNAMPANVTQPGGLVPFIQVRTREVLGFDEAKRVAGLIESSRPAPGAQATALHLAVLRQTHGSRFGARQAVLGLGLVTVLLAAAGNLVHRVSEMPGRFPSLEASAVHSPFAEDSAPPRIELPGVAGMASPPAAAGAVGMPAVAPAIQAVARVSPDTAHRLAEQRQEEAIDDRLAWESSLMCAYSEDSRRCACYEPQGRKAEMDFASCRALADRGPGAGRNR